MFFILAYKFLYFEMIKLYFNIEDSLHFSVVQLIKHAKYPNSNHISSSVGVKDGLRFDYGPSTDKYK